VEILKYVNNSLLIVMD